MQLWSPRYGSVKRRASPNPRSSENALQANSKSFIGQSSGMPAP